jgi:hypothetical protein
LLSFVIAVGTKASRNSKVTTLANIKEGYPWSMVEGRNGKIVGIGVVSYEDTLLAAITKHYAG